MKTKYINIIIFSLFFWASIDIALAQKENISQADIVIKATVVDELKQPVKGVNVTINEGFYETVTDENGIFHLRLKKLDGILTFECIGYETCHIDISELKQDGVIVLKKSILYAGMEDEVVLPFRNNVVRNLVGAVSVIKEDELSKSNQMNVLNILSGKLLGLNVMQVPTEPGRSATKLNVRGLSRSLTDNDPLIIIDGIERPLEDLMSDEIESISVLKDATSKVLYGSKAANGVLIVKTKRGLKYKRERQFAVELGMQTPTRMPEYLNSFDYAQMYNQARINDGLSPYYSEEAIQAYRLGNDPTRYPDVDFHKLALNDNMIYRKATAQFRGGNQSTLYYVNLGYMGNGGFEAVGNNNTSNKFNLRANLDYQVNDWLKTFVDISGQMEFYTTNYMTTDDLFNRLSTHRPNSYPIEFVESSSSGNKFWGAMSNANLSSSRQNLYAEMLLGGMKENTVRKGQTNIGFELNLDNYIKGLRAKAYLTFDVYNNLIVGKDEDFSSYRPLYNDGTIIGKELMTVEKKVSDKKKITDDMYRNYGYVGQLMYERVFKGKHQLNSDLIFFQSKRENLGFAQDDVNRTFGLRTNYVYDNKWIAELDMAIMGSSHFVGNNQYGYFPTMGVAWILSEEEFLKDRKWIDFLKLKSSVGLLGTDQYLDYYLFESRWNTSDGSVHFGPKLEDNINISTLQHVGNPELTWEKSLEFNIGAEALLFKNLGVELNYFNNYRYDIFTPTTSYSTVNGGTLMYRNYERIRNQGVELRLNYSGSVGDFRYSVGGNMLWSKAKYIKADDMEGLPENKKKKGNPVDAYWGMQADGLFKNNNEILSHTVQDFGPVQIGDVKYVDINKDNRVDENDMLHIGNEYPRLQFGLNLNLSYRGWELYMSGSGMAQYDIYLSNSYYWVREDQKYSKFVRNYFNPVTGKGIYPRLTSKQNTNNYRCSTLWLRNGNFFKLRDVMLSYSLPNNLVNKLSLRQIKIFARGSNLLTFSSVKDLDPEYIDAGVTGYPFFRTLTGGISIVF